MEVRASQLAAHLAPAKPGQAQAESAPAWAWPVCVVTGDEPLQWHECCDAWRAAAHRHGYTERQVHSVNANQFDWSVLEGGLQEQSLFGGLQCIELRLPSGKPGKDGAACLQSVAERVGQWSAGSTLLLALPRLDKAQRESPWFKALERVGLVVRCDPLERAAMLAWIRQRLGEQGLSLSADANGQAALEMLAERVEGNLMAAHQEILKLGLLHPPGVLSLPDIEEAVVDVARFNVFQLSEAVFSSDASRLYRMLDALQAEGEAATLVLWALSDDIRALYHCKVSLEQGQALASVLRARRIWGPREQAFMRVLPTLSMTQLARLMVAASHVDGVIKGLPHPRWPSEPWAALRQLAQDLRTAMSTGARGRARARDLSSS